MTGFGEARRSTSALDVLVELRSVNNRYLKLVTKCPDGYGSLEAEIEAVLREQVKRGTVQILVRIQRQKRAEDYKLNSVALASYWQQIRELQTQWQISEPVRLERLLNLRGVVVDDRDQLPDIESDWPVIREALIAARENLVHMRQQEGRAMAHDLEGNLANIGDQLGQIEQRAPEVVQQYRTRLHQRLTQALNEHQVNLDPNELIKEVSLFADRSDISEEIVRLRSHLAQMGRLIRTAEASGRKLDFLTQEMFREANTIGSKANDVDIARCVVEIKTQIERIREMVQNVE